MDARDFRLQQIEQGELWEELKVDHQWFHFVRGMVFSGKLAEMGPMGVVTYVILKAHTNFETGEAFPSIKRIAELAGTSHDTIQRAMRKLIEMGLVTVDKSGKVNRYMLTESIDITRKNGEPFATAMREYQPNQFKDFIGQLKAFAESGNLPSDRAISINVTFNVQNIHQGDNGTVTMNVQNVSIPDGGNEPGLLSDFEERMKRLRLIE